LDAVHKDIAEASKAITDSGLDITEDVRDLDVGLRAWQAPSPDAVKTKQETQDQASGIDASDG
jgi:hypothetical protein